MEYKSDILQNDLFEGFANASDSVYIYVCDMSTGISRWSENAVNYFGLDEEYIINAGELWGGKVHPDDRQIYFDDIEAVFSGKRNNHACQYRALNRFGKYVWLECKGTMTYDENGNQKVFAGMMTRLDNQSKYDSLTGIPTRDGLYDFDFDSGEGSIILFGIDSFRKIVSTYGYFYGDEILMAFVKSISGILSGNDKLIRFQGDEFIVILSDADSEDSIRIFDGIKKVISQIRMQDGRVISLTVSGGCEFYPIKNGNKDDIINHLELAMDYAKQNARHNLVFYSGEIEKSQIRKNILKNDLRNAIGNNFAGFELYFQPWIDAKTSSVVGCESLLRFKGEEIKDAGPVEFIPILEEDNSIVEVGYWVMREAMKQQKAWQDEYGDFKVSFNVSYRQFFDDNFALKVKKTAEEFGIKPENIILELTESREVDRPESLAHIFEDIRSNHFQIALDDFGTGYASLEVLKKLPVDGIKIEHSFVRELKEEESQIDLAIIEAIMYLCKKLNCLVVVEGVENKSVDAIIKKMAADYLQGYYYSRPVCKDDFNKLLAQSGTASE